MKKNKYLWTIICLSLVLSVVISGCSKGKGETPEVKAPEAVEGGKGAKDTIIYAINTTPTGIFNPLIANTSYDVAVTGLVYDSLLAYDEGYNLEKRMAKDYEISDDKLSLTFTIKDNIKWHDGTPFTLEDIYFTMASAASEKYEGGLYNSVKRIKGVEDYKTGKSDKISGIEILDANNIKFTLEEPYALALEGIGGMQIIPKHIWEKIQVQDWKESNEVLTNPIGTGPFKLTKFDNGQAVYFEKFDDFYLGEPKTAKLIFKVVNPETVQGELKNGTVDIADISTFKNDEVKDVEKEGFNVLKYPHSQVYYMGINLRQERFKDARVRQALMYGINREQALTQLADGNGVLINIPMMPTSWAYPAKGEINEYEYNVEKAKELLKEAGWEDRDNDGIVENAKGEKLAIKLHSPSDQPAQQQRAVLIQSNLKDIGIEVEILSMEFSTLMQEVVGDHEYDVYLMANTMRIDPDPLPNWHSSAVSDEKNNFAWNISAYKNPEVDKIMEDAVKIYDQEERKALYLQYAKIMNHDVPWVTFFAPNTIKATNPKLKNYSPNTKLDFIRVEDWVIEE